MSRKITRRKILRNIGASTTGVGIAATKTVAADPVESENLKQKLQAVPTVSLLHALDHPEPTNTEHPSYDKKGPLRLYLDEAESVHLDEESDLTITKIPTDIGEIGITEVDETVLSAVFRFEEDLSNEKVNRLDHLWNDIGYETSEPAFVIATEHRAQFGRDTTDSEAEAAESQVNVDAQEIVAFETSESSGYRIVYDSGYIELDTNFNIMKNKRSGNKSADTQVSSGQEVGTMDVGGGHDGFTSCAGDDIFLCTSDMTTTYSSCKTAGTACSISVSTGPYGWAACAAVFTLICGPAIALHGLSDSCSNVFSCARQYA